VVAVVVAAVAAVVAAAAAVVFFLSFLPTVMYHVRLAKAITCPHHLNGEVNGSPRRKAELSRVLRMRSGCWVVWSDGPRARMASCQREIKGEGEEAVIKVEVEVLVKVVEVVEVATNGATRGSVVSSSSSSSKPSSSLFPFLAVLDPPPPTFTPPAHAPEQFDRALSHAKL
jgi:hypothetical protein